MLSIVSIVNGGDVEGAAFVTLEGVKTFVTLEGVKTFSSAGMLLSRTRFSCTTSRWTS